MTLNQLKSLSEDEISIALYIVNVISPIGNPKIEFESSQLVWIRHDRLIKKLLDAFPKIHPDGHEIFSSLMEKLGVKIEIKQNITTLPISASNQSSISSESGSMSPDITGSI